MIEFYNPDKVLFTQAVPDEFRRSREAENMSKNLLMTKTNRKSNQQSENIPNWNENIIGNYDRRTGSGLHQIDLSLIKIHDNYIGHVLFRAPYATNLF